MHIDDKNKNILILVAGPTPGLDNTTITTGDKYSINFTKSGKTFALSLYYNGSNSSLLVNAVKICQFKTKDAEIKPYPLFLGNTSKDFTLDFYEKSLLKESVKVFSVDCNAIDASDILDTAKYLIKEI